MRPFTILSLTVLAFSANAEEFRIAPAETTQRSPLGPVDGVYELYDDVVEPEWTVNAPRRRTARH